MFAAKDLEALIMHPISAFAERAKEESAINALIRIGSMIGRERLAQLAQNLVELENDPDSGKFFREVKSEHFRTMGWVSDQKASENFHHVELIGTKKKMTGTCRSCGESKVHCVKHLFDCKNRLKVAQR